MTEQAQHETASRLVFDTEFLRKLERLELLARKVFRGQLRGERSTQRRGRGLEFTDFRLYRPGDDVRHIDWNIFSRLDRLFLKLYASEEDVCLHLLLDVSASMDFGEPSKFDHARRLTAALAYIGLANLDRVSITTFAEGMLEHLPPMKARSRFSGVLDFLAELTCHGETAFSSGSNAFVSRVRTPGIVVLVSDLLAEEDVRAALQVLANARHEVVVMQLLAEDEIDPPLDGALRLLDGESDGVLDVLVDSELRALYQSRLQTRLDAIEAFCRARGIEYLRASTAIPFEDVVLKYLRQGALVR